MNVEHETWSMRRTYPHPPAAVFAAWADGATKIRWFDVTDSGGEYHLDFRVGGVETYRSPVGVTPVYTYDAIYYDIVPTARMVTAYTMTADGRRLSVSVATVEFAARPGGTDLVYTEQGAYLDGLDSPGSRRQGLTTQLEALGKLLGATSED